MNVKVNKETMVSLGNAGLKLGKHIFIEGSKAVALKAAARAINVGFEEGFDSVKKITLDDVVNSDMRGKLSKTKSKKKRFGKKEEVVEELIEEIIENPETAEDVVAVEEDVK